MSLKELRKKKNLTQDEVAIAIGVKRSALSNYENGIREPNNEILRKLASFYSTSVENLLGWSVSYSITPSEAMKIEEQIGTYNIETKTYDSPAIKSVAIRFLGTASCGVGIQNGDYMEILDLPKEWIKGYHEDYFLCYASGDSMINSGILDHSLILAKSINGLENGQIGVFHLNDEEYIKKYHKINNIIILKSTNSSYDDIYVTEKDRFKIIGRVTKVIIDLE